jgi:Dolichyl-phosphate-mannose-protein mannosyltransferase
VEQRESLYLQKVLPPEVSDDEVEAADFKMEEPKSRTLSISSRLGSLLKATFTLSQAGVFALCFALAALLSWSAGGFRAEYGGFPDEAAHYVTSLMIRDYIAGWFPGAPMRFAENYYFHYPKVAIGHWPPVFHSIQATWMLLFGVSRESVLVLISLLEAAVAFVIYKLVRRYFGTGYGLWAALLYLLLAPVQFETTADMTEPALSLFGLLAITSFARFLENESWSAAIGFAWWTSVALLTKGDGLSFALVAPLALVFARRLPCLASPRLWVAAVIVAAFCGPYTLLTHKMVQQGWAGNFGWAYSSMAAPAVAKLIVSTFGAVLVSLALLGAVAAVRRRALAPIFPCMAAYGIGILVFQIFVPTGVEVRKLIMAFPAVLFLAAAGAAYVAELLKGRVQPAWTAAALVVLGTAAWSVGGFSVVKREQRGYKPVAQYILSNPALQDAVILVSGCEPSISEGILIAEIASREHRPGHFVLRAGKVIAHTDWSGAQDYQLLFHNATELLQGLDAIPVDVVVADFPPTLESPPHHALLVETMQRHPDRWKLLYTAVDPAAPGGVRQIGVFQTTKPATRRDLKLKLDMSKTLGRTLQSPSH